MEFKHFLLVSIGCAFVAMIFPIPMIILAVVVAIFLSDADPTLLGCSRFGSQPESLRGQVIWITGASSGIGEGLAYELAKVGCKLILSARRADELERVKSRCIELSPPGFKDTHSVVKLDLMDYESHSKCVKEVMQNYDRIDYLVNNAGRYQRGEAINTSLEVDKALLDLNTIGTISVTKAVLPQMVKQKKGLIVVVSSIAGKLGSPCSSGYSASKHALQGYFDALRMELSDTGVDVLSVCPALVVSDIVSNALSTDLNTPVTDDSDIQTGRMSTQRCAYLMVVAMANRLHEVWISPNPVLLFTYLSQFTPATAKWLGQWLGGNRVKSFRRGDPKGSYTWSALTQLGSK